MALAASSTTSVSFIISMHEHSSLEEVLLPMSMFMFMSMAMTAEESSKERMSDWNCMLTKRCFIKVIIIK